jgi:hypothetical protein
VTKSWRSELSNPLRYEEQLERMHARYAGTRLETLTHDGVKLAELMYDKRRVSRMVARAVGEGTYALSPAQARFVQLKDRQRELFYFEALDFLVHCVVGDIIAEAIEPQLSPNLYSYRRKFSSWHAVRRFAAEVRAHTRGRAPRERGLYVIRADVRKYAETVPVGDRSVIWDPLREVLGLKADEWLWAFIRKVVRPDLVDDEGAPSLRWRGLPLGSPTATILLNYYLQPFDTAMDAIDGAFYLRFGDDILFPTSTPRSSAPPTHKWNRSSPTASSPSTPRRNGSTTSTARVARARSSPKQSAPSRSSSWAAASRSTAPSRCRPKNGASSSPTSATASPKPSRS